MQNIQIIRAFLRLPFTINIKNARTIFGEAFSPNNHLVRTLSEYDSGIKDFRKTTLFRFHSKFIPKSICNMIPNENLNKKSKTLPLGIYPWGKWYRKIDKNWNLSRFCGPTPLKKTEEEWENLIDLYTELQKGQGYLPQIHGFPKGALLVDEKNYRFIVLQGNHRTAILKHLGYEQTIVRLLLKIPSFVQKKPYKWEFVKRGILTEEESLKIFEWFFREGGIFY